jgi:DNA-binding NtrC family response regulator
MTKFVVPVKRVLVVDRDDDFLALAVGWMRGQRDVVVESNVVAAFERCRAERFDLVICEIFFGGKPAGIDLVNKLYEENQLKRRLALASNGLSVRSALGLARELPADIMIREKRVGVFDSILHEAETGENPDDLWDDGVNSFTKAKRQFARRVLARAGYNRSEAARRLGVSRATMVRYTDPSQH